ncbi:Vegetative incompatibility protein HET-E-1 [Apiospora aurea]|uniref:Vegetative incompatibility protein HET-E-1 n=1 Tax=Apiospora aurea TaxID=335848 RepID=A0ABR1Q4X5_9PEZI
MPPSPSLPLRGRDSNKELPGVSIDRVTKEDPYRHENFPVTWIPPTPGGPYGICGDPPFFDPRDDYAPGDIVDYAGFFLAGLSWRHVATTATPPNPAPRARGAKQLQQPPHPVPPGRRKKFPSWSWTGMGRRRGLAARGHAVRGARARPRYRPPRLPTLVRGQVDAVPARRPARLVQRIRSGHLKAQRLGTIGEAEFLLVVRKRGRSYYRVGLLQVRSAVITEGVRDQDVRVFKLK